MKIDTPILAAIPGIPEERMTRKTEAQLKEDGMWPLTHYYNLRRPEEKEMIQRVVEDMERGNSDYAVQIVAVNGLKEAQVWRVMPQQVLSDTHAHNLHGPCGWAGPAEEREQWRAQS